MNMDEKGTGSIASPVDYRDLIARAALMPAPFAFADLPETMHTDLGTLLDQNKIPACVAHDVVYLIRRYWYNKTGHWIRFSPRFLDTLAKRFDGLDIGSDGTYPRLVLKLAMLYGCATEATLPNDTTLPTELYRADMLLTDEVFAEAAQYKIPGFVNVGTDPVSTRNAVYLYEAVSSLFKIGNDLFTPSWFTKDIDPLRPPKNIISGHQLAVIGWEGDLNRGRNEWGIEWNIDGEFHYDPDAWHPYITEQWAIADVPAHIKEFLSRLPSPKDFHYKWTTDLHRGDHNNDVGMAQVAYMILGHLKPIAPEEFGYFGAKTAMANHAYQSAHREIFPPSPDNIGKMTRAALNKKFA